MESIHHVAFQTDNYEKTKARFSENSYEEVQSGGFGTGEYHYFDTSRDLKFVFEILKFWN